MKLWPFDLFLSDKIAVYTYKLTMINKSGLEKLWEDILL